MTDCSALWLRLGGWTGLLLSAVGVVAGAVVVVTDLAETDDEMHGLGVILGLAVVLVSAVPAVLAAVALRLRLRRPTASAILLVVLGVVLAVLAPALSGFFLPYGAPFGLAVALAVLGLGVAALVVLRRTPGTVRPDGTPPVG